MTDINTRRATAARLIADMYDHIAACAAMQDTPAANDMIYHFACGLSVVMTDGKVGAGGSRFATKLRPGLHFKNGKGEVATRVPRCEALARDIDGARDSIATLMQVLND